MSQALQLLRDEASVLERQVEHLWLEPERVDVALEAATRELAKVRAEIRSLDCPERYRVSLILTSCTLTFMAVVAFASWLIGGL